MLQLGYGSTQVVIDTRKHDPKGILRSIQASNRPILGHNIKYDYQVIATNYGIRLENLWDTMIAAQIVECGNDAPKGHFSLEQCASRYVRAYYSGQGNLFAPTVTKQTRLTFASIGNKPFTEAQIYYGAMDVESTFLLKKKLEERAKQLDLERTLKLEFEFIKVLGDMELNGIFLEGNRWLSNSQEVAKQAKSLHDELLTHFDINWDSPKQAVTALKGMGVDVLTLDKKTGEIKESVGRIVLLKQEARFSILKTYLDYKMLKKKAVSYGDKFLRHINPHSGRVHSSFMQVMRTGRISSTSPNLQNISRGDVYRSAFMAEEGHSFVVADFSNQEARIIADKSGDPNMLKACGSGTDFHLEIAKIAFNDSTLTKDSEERRIAKSIGFLIAYGGGAKKLSEQFDIPMQRAKSLIRGYYDSFPKLEAYFANQGLEAKKFGYVICNPVSGRKSFVPFFNDYVECKKYVEKCNRVYVDPHPKVKDAYNTWDSKIQRWSQNIPIQGTAADIGKRAGILLRKFSKKIPFKIVLFVHDEIILECPDEFSHTVAKILEKCCLDASREYTTHLDIPAKAVITKIWNK